LRDRLKDVKALTLDTGGTVLDWHASVAHEFRKLGSLRGISADWGEATNAWRRLSLGRLKGEVPEGRARPNADEVHRETLEEVVKRFGLGALSEEDRSRLVRRWHALDPWPDVREGLGALRRRYLLAPLTILNAPLVIDVSRRSGLCWDCVISCDMMGVYKPRPEAYLTAAQWLGLEPAEILMVACHNHDLLAAGAVGFRTAFVARPDEWGPDEPTEPTPHPHVDVVATDFVGLARVLGTHAGAREDGTEGSASRR